MQILLILCIQSLATKGLRLNGQPKVVSTEWSEGLYKLQRFQELKTERLQEFQTWSAEYTTGVKKAKLNTWHDLVRAHREHMKSVLDPDEMSSNLTMALQNFAAAAVATAGGSFYTLLTSVFLTPVLQSEKDHSVEVLASLAANVANPMFKEIHVLLENSKSTKDSSTPSVAAALKADPCLELKMALATLDFHSNEFDKKLVCSHVTSIPFYSDFVKYANDKLQRRLVSIANGDIVFDLSLGKVNQDFLENGKKVVVLSVKPAPYVKLHQGKNLYAGCKPVNRCNHGFIDHWLHSGNSWDVYLFQSPLPPMDLSHVEHPMNLPGAENSFAYTLNVRGGLRLENDCKNVHAFHWHCAAKTHGNWAEYMHIPPERLGNIMPAAIQAKPWYQNESFFSTKNQNLEVIEEVEADLLCKTGTRIKLQDQKSLFLFQKGDVTTYLCCPEENSACEQDWLGKLRNNPNYMDAKSAFCHSPEDVTCLVYTGDKESKALMQCPTASSEFGDKERDECNTLFGRFWPFAGDATLPIGGGMPEVRESDDVKYHRGDHLLQFVQGREGSTSLLNTLREQKDYLGFYTSGECMAPDPTDKREVKVRHDWRTACKTHYPDLAYNFLEQVPANKTTWLITVVRNGLHRGISEFFMTWYNWIWPTRPHVQAPRLDYENFQKVTKDELMDYYEDFIWGQKDWFQSFLTPMIGFDVKTVKEPLRKDGYVLRQLRYANGKNINLLVLRFDAVEQWSIILKKFFPRFPSTPFKHSTTQPHDEFRHHQNDFKKTLCEDNHLPTQMVELRKYENMEFYEDTEALAFVDKLKTYCGSD